MRKLASSILAVILLTTGVAVAKTKADKKVKPKPVTVSLKDAKGQAVGTATLKSDGQAVAIVYNFKNLPPGEHALHVHKNAKCDGADGFKSAGPHFNPEGKKHGLQNPDGPHAGDMPNFKANDKGVAKGTLQNPRVTLGEGSPNSVFADGGTALVIHAKADDEKTDPAGNAGDRIACGVITR
ncbi:MAG: superoxide dismutase family protein [Acidobacteriia bacterium]|nr:superoxide dismutase family protein [Terriglobia bacterium]